MTIPAPDVDCIDANTRCCRIHEAASLTKSKG
jgi:hypothetical protein